MSKTATILIKKTDGSTERISLEEFRKRKFAQGESVLDGDKEDDLLVLLETHLANTTPVKEVFENEAEADFVLHKDYHKSLLDEDFSEIKNLKNKNNFENNIKQEKKSIKDGAVSVGEYNLNDNKIKFNNFIEAEQKINENKILQNKVVKKINDIEMPEIEKNKRTLGPVEEILQFDLKDYLRLSNDPSRASEMFLMKFENIKKESYLFFIKFLKAWKKAPLYKLYLETILGALKENKNIKDYCLENKKLEYDIFMNLVKINKKIKV